MESPGLFDLGGNEKGREERAAPGFPAKLLDPVLSLFQRPCPNQEPALAHWWGTWAPCPAPHSVPGLLRVSWCAGQPGCVYFDVPPTTNPQCPNHLPTVPFLVSCPPQPARKRFKVFWVTVQSLTSVFSICRRVAHPGGALCQGFPAALRKCSIYAISFCNITGVYLFFVGGILVDV